MHVRIPAVAAVVGALLVGGATTGTTYASWRDQVGATSGSLTSGSMAFTATAPAGVTVAKSAGASATTTFVLDDTSLGKNLKQRITSQVASTPTGVTATVGTSCPGAASVQVNTTPTSADVTLCVRVVSSATAVSGNVTLSVAGAQQPSGWTTAASTVTVPVTVGSAPAAPNPTCDTNNRGISWAAVPNATAYVVSTSAAQTSGYSDEPSQTTRTYTPNLSGQQTLFIRVRATNSVGSSGSGATIRIVRNGSSYTCGVVTP